MFTFVKSLITVLCLQWTNNIRQHYVSYKLHTGITLCLCNKRLNQAPRLSIATKPRTVHICGLWTKFTTLNGSAVYNTGSNVWVQGTLVSQASTFKQVKQASSQVKWSPQPSGSGINTLIPELFWSVYRFQWLLVIVLHVKTIRSQHLRYVAFISLFNHSSFVYIVQ